MHRKLEDPCTTTLAATQPTHFFDIAFHSLNSHNCFDLGSIEARVLNSARSGHKHAKSMRSEMPVNQTVASFANSHG